MPFADYIRSLEESKITIKGVTVELGALLRVQTELQPGWDTPQVVLTFNLPFGPLALAALGDLLRLTSHRLENQCADASRAGQATSEPE